ncbi:uncharacterized protein LOC142220780 [Haematobia irritans]|uniref:uncharacterized protein LOC142220780 n=1 Tax=Haematobia irritans TaxID=7368 RepID=UPI003F509EE0
MLKSFKIYTCSNGSLGLHLSRAPWDPYPWVSNIQKDSTSYNAGLRVGDCLLELNGNDVLGLKISEIAALLKNHWLTESSNHVTMLIWRKKAKDATTSDAEDDEDEENNAHNINQQSLQKFATCLQHIAQLLECPVCLEVVKPPGWQCCNGHVLCNNCRSRSEKCPVCRVPLGPRGRCLLSDKLFTLLADSFPCDGVRSSNKGGSPTDRRKCSTEFHNQPKMAIVSNKSKHQQHHQDNEDDADKAKDLKKMEQDKILSSLRMGRRRRTKSKKEEGHTVEGPHQENKRPHHGSTPLQECEEVPRAVVNVQMKSTEGIISNRKSSQDSSNGSCVTATVVVQVPGILSKNSDSSKNILTENGDLMAGRDAPSTQCYCRTCFQSAKVALPAGLSSNKFLLRIQDAIVDEQRCRRPPPHHHQQLSGQRENYQCPTGKLCCLQQNVMPTNAVDVANMGNHHQQMTNSQLSTKQTMSSTNTTTATTTTASMNKILLQNEWQVLTHLTQDHQMAVNQYYAEFGQRITIREEQILQNTVICLNLKGSGCHGPIEKFFVAFVPMAMSENMAHPLSMDTNMSSNTSKVAVFIWHMNPLASVTDDHSSLVSSSSYPVDVHDDEVSNFDAIIENPKTGIKWFGRAHCLTTPWSQIYHKQHFLIHEVMEGHKQEENSKSGDGDCDGAAAFVIVIKEKS